MIHWLIESALDLQEKPEWFLSKAEQEKYASFRSKKRRDEWLLGRWTAKRLLQAMLLGRDDYLVALDAIEIANDADGAPFATCNPLLVSGRAPQSVAWNLSLSHSREHALCAISPLFVGEGAGERLGADLEYIEPRAGNFVGDYFTAREIARVNASAPAQRDIVVNAIWSAKEAALKALRKGLSVDTRAVEISIAPFQDASEQWTRFEIELCADARRGLGEYELGDHALDDHKDAPLQGWWRVWENFVLTIAASDDDMPARQPLFAEALLITQSAVRSTTGGTLHDQGHGLFHRRIAQATRHHARREPRP